MSTSRQWQLNRTAAEQYLEVLEPAILGPAAEALVDHVAPRAGDRIIDVGCGTGAASLHAARLVGSDGHVTGVDINPGMIATARSRPAPEAVGIEWVEGSAFGLPVPDSSYDVAVSAQMLQFVPDRAGAVSEFGRVVRQGGSVAVSLWCPIERSPYFAALVASIAEFVDPETAGGLDAAFALSDEEEILSLFNQGFESVAAVAVEIEIELPPIREFVPRHIGATPMGAGFAAASAEAQAAVVHRMIVELEPFRSGDGCRVPFASYFVTGTVA